MAYDDVPGSDPRGPICPGCHKPILKEEQRVILHHPTGPPSIWHGECSRPFWDKITPMMARLGWVKLENPKDPET